MIRRFLPTALLGFITIIIFNWSCTKLDTTNLGSDLLPVVDNVNTFADTIDIDAYQGIFNDTTAISRFEDHVLGTITTSPPNGDPDFGSTRADMYLQLKPGYFPYWFTQQKTDTLVGLDSVILCLSFRGSWGDSTTLQRINVREIPDNTTGEWDSLGKPRKLSYAPTITGVAQPLLFNNAPYQEVDIRRINDKVKYNRGKDSVTGQIRLRLNNAFLNKLAKADSAEIERMGFDVNSFYKDSIFRANFEGFIIESLGGNALMTINLSDPRTRLEVHYRKRSNNVLDTTYTGWNLSLGQSTAPSAVANKVTRDYTNAAFSTTPRVPKPVIYLQATPGTFAELSIPRLNTYRDTNRIIHRAQIRIIQMPRNNTDNIYAPPNFLYLDLRDSSAPAVVKHKPIYFDLNPSMYYNPDNIPAGFYFPQDIDFGYFGGFGKLMADPSSATGVSYYDFNITRYLQRMLINRDINYEMRLFAPYSFSYPQYSSAVIAYPNNLGYGRVKVGGTRNDKYKMQLVVIWSKIKKQ